VLAQQKSEVGKLRDRMIAALRRDLADARAELANDAARLDAMSPLAVLARGYAIATTTEGRAIREATDVSVGDTIEIRAHAARIDATITRVREGKP
jgi:exodeoxyribonuclease VII large subunit